MSYPSILMAHLSSFHPHFALTRPEYRVTIILLMTITFITKEKENNILHLTYDISSITSDDNLKK